VFVATLGPDGRIYGQQILHEPLAPHVVYDAKLTPEGDLYVSGRRGFSEESKSPRVCVYLGDHPADMAAARAVPATAIGVLTGAHSADELHAAGADTVLANLTDFPQWLEQRHDVGWVGTQGSLAW
jgi:beta-phosphoglucomutase-like phosphatase (HAD superfamily)